MDISGKKSDPTFQFFTHQPHSEIISLHCGQERPGAF